MNLGALIMLINVVAWLAFFIGVYIAIYRYVRRRGRIIMLSVILSVGLTLLILLACLSAQLGAISSALSRQVSPSHATLVAVATDTSDKVALSGLSARDGSVIWRRPLDLFDPTGMVNGGTIYIIGSAQVTGAGPMVEALRLSDGASLWRLALPATPTRQMRLADGLLILGAFVGAAPPSGEIIAVSLATHTLRWRVSVPTLTTIRGYAQLAVSGGLLYIGSEDGSVRAVRLSDGALIWKLRISATPTSGPVANAPVTLGVASDGARLIVYDSTGEVASLRPSDGATLWGRQIPTYPYDAEWAMLSDSSLYLCGLDPVTHARALLALDPATGVTRWSRDANCTYASPITSGANLYLLDSTTLSALRANDGAPVWRGAPEERDLGYADLSSDAGAIFAATTIANYRILGVCANWNSPGLTICHSTRYVTAFDAATGQRYWRTSDGYDALITPETA